MTYSCLIPPIKVFIHSNVLIGCWDMICCVCIMHLVYMQQLLLCRAPWNSRKLQDSHIWLIPNITAVIYSNLFLGHWDMVYVVYIQHSSSCRVQFRSKELKESQIRFIPTIQAFTHPNLCRPQLNSRTLYLNPMWLIPNTQVDWLFCLLA